MSNLKPRKWERPFSSPVPSGADIQSKAKRLGSLQEAINTTPDSVCLEICSECGWQSSDGNLHAANLIPSGPLAYVAALEVQQY